MSVHKRAPKRYQVKWREGGRQRSRTFTREGDANTFDLEMKRRRQLGPLASSVIMSRVTLAEFVEEEWWPRYAIPNLDEETRRRYLEVWGVDLEPRLGGYQLREITPMVVEDLAEQLASPGRKVNGKASVLSVASQRKALHLLSGILKRGVVRGLIPANPVDAIAMPKAPPARGARPLPPVTVERIRWIMLQQRTRTVPASGAGQRPRRAYQAPVGSPLDRQRNALIVSMLAYVGLRPSEDRELIWDDLQDRTLRVYATKTRRERHVDLLAPIAQELAEWRLACGRPAGDQLIVPRPSGGEWTKHDWDNWRGRVWRPAAIAAGVTGDLRPYRLRHSFVSLLLWSGTDIVEVAEQAGHSVATLARHYAGVIRELKGQPRVPAAEAIRLARAEATGQLRLGESHA